MSFSPRSIGAPPDFNVVARQVIRAGEGPAILRVKDVGDDTAKIGYGYTFVREDAAKNWFVPNFFVADLLATGRQLILAHTQKLDDFSVALNASKSREKEADLFQNHGPRLLVTLRDREINLSPFSVTTPTQFMSKPKNGTLKIRENTGPS